MKRVITVLLCLVLLGCLWGCQETKEKAKEAQEENCTKYSLSSIIMDSMTMTGEEAREYSGIDDLYIKFYEDGTAKMRLEKEPLNLCYDGEYLWQADNPEEKVSYAMNGISVAVYDGAFTYNFTLE